MRQGESGREMFLLIAGRPKVFVEEGGQIQFLSSLEPGTSVRKIALFGDNIRPAHGRTIHYRFA